MSRSFLHAAALLTTGLVLGLGAGAWLWRGGAEQRAKAPPGVTARPPDPAALRRQADRARDETRDGATARPGADRVAELAATFRALEGSTEEGLSTQMEAIVGLAGLTSDELARLMELASVQAWAARDLTAAQAAVATLPPERRGNLLEIIHQTQAAKK